MSEIKERQQPDNETEEVNPQDDQENKKERNPDLLHQVSDFAEQNYFKERQILMDEVKKYWDDYEELDKQLQENLEKRGTELAEAGEQLQGVFGILTQMEEKEKELTSTRLKRLCNHFELKELRNGIESQRGTVQELETGKKEAESLYEDLKGQPVEQEHIKKGWQMVEDFYLRMQDEYEKKDEERKRIEELEAEMKDREARDLKKVSEDNKAFFIHAIHRVSPPEAKGASFVYLDSAWQTKAKIVMGFEPTLSASSLDAKESGRQNFTRENMAANSGVILTGGRIESAMEQDSASHLSNLKDRTTALWGISKNEEIKTAIWKAVNFRTGRNRYNEFTVANPQVGGLFACPHGEKFKPTSQEEAQEMAEFADKENIPFYLFLNGESFQVHGADFEIFKAKKSVGRKKKAKAEEEKPLEWYQKLTTAERKKSFSEVMNNGFELTAEKRQEMMEEVCEQSPFRIERLGSQEVNCILRRNEGRLKFMEVNEDVVKDEEPFGEEQTYKGEGLSGLEYNYKPAPDLKSGDTIKVISEVVGVREKTRYFFKDKMLFCERSELKEHDWDRSVPGGILDVSVRQVEYHYNKNISFPAGLHTEALSLNISNSQSFLDEAERNINGAERRSKEKQWHEKGYDNYLQEMAFLLYGFGEQAKEIGDEKTAEKAFGIAQQLFDRNNYEEILKKRIKEDGQLKILPEDLIK